MDSLCTLSKTVLQNLNLDNVVNYFAHCVTLSPCFTLSIEWTSHSSLFTLLQFLSDLSLQPLPGCDPGAGDGCLAACPGQTGVFSVYYPLSVSPAPAPGFLTTMSHEPVPGPQPGAHWVVVIL